MKSVRSFALGLVLLFAVCQFGQAQTSPAQALENVTIHKADGSTINSGTVVWRNGLIVAAGRNADIPFDAYVIDGGDSLHVYPGFVDGMALWGSPDLPERYETPDRPGEPGYERAGIQPQRNPFELLKESDDFETAQKNGFTTAALGLKGQMLPGQVDIFFLNGKETGKHLMAPGIAVLSSLEEAPGGFGGGAYPATTMGVMAEYRQLWYDAEALMEQQQYFASTSSNYPAPEKNSVLEALFPVINKEQPLYFDVDTKENIERVFMLQDELDFDLILVSGKEAHEMAEELKKRNVPVLASIDLPDQPEWLAKEKKDDDEESETKEEMEEITEEMRIFRERQEEAYKASIDNVKRLIDAGVEVGYVSNGMKLSDLSKHVKTLIEETDLTGDDVLRMITQQTANILGIGNRVGDIQSGRIASFSVFTKPFTEDKSQVKYSVSDGNLTEFEITASNDGKEKE